MYPPGSVQIYTCSFHNDNALFSSQDEAHGIPRNTPPNSTPPPPTNPSALISNRTRRHVFPFSRFSHTCGSASFPPKPSRTR